MTRDCHPDKDIEVALKYVETKGWHIELAGSSSHAWGRAYCPYNSKDCRCGKFCIASIWTTPKSSTNHAKQIKRLADSCTAPSTKKGGQK